MGVLSRAPTVGMGEDARAVRPYYGDGISWEWCAPVACITLFALVEFLSYFCQRVIGQ